MAKKPVPEVVAIGEIKKLGSAYEDHQTRAIFYLLYLTGARISEVLDLRIRDLELVNAEDGQEILTAHLLTRKNKIQKTRDIPAIVGPVEKEMVDSILDYIMEAHGEDAEEEGKIFSLDRRSAYNRIARKKIMVRATHGTEVIPFYELKLRPHYLRHVRLTHLVQLYGFTDTALTRFAGWTNSKPAQIYVNLNVEDLVRLMRGGSKNSVAIRKE